MPYLKDLSKKSSSPLSTSTQNTYSDPREKTILVLSKIIRISGYVALVSFPIFLIEMYILKQIPYSLPILFLSFFLFCMLSFTCYLLRREVAKATRCKAEKEAIIVPTEFTIFAYQEKINFWDWLLRSIHIAFTLFMFYISLKSDFLSIDWWKGMGIVVLSIIAFFYNLHKEPLHFTQLHCYEDLMEVLPKEGKTIYLKTQDIRGGRFYLKGRKNYIKRFGIQFQIRDSLVNIDIPLSADDYFLLKKYFKQYPAPLHDNVQDNNIFKEHYYY